MIKTVLVTTRALKTPSREARLQLRACMKGRRLRNGFKNSCGQPIRLNQT